MVHIVVALIALAALIVAILANRNAGRSTDASQDSAREAKRRADAAERQAAAAEAALPPPPPAVAWTAELRSTARKGKGATFFLRNVGSSTVAGDRIGLTALTGVEHPRPGGQLRGHVHHDLAVGDQPLGDVPADAVAAFGRPDPVLVLPAELEHRLIAGAVGAEPALREDPLAVVDDLDSRGPLVRSIPMMTCPMPALLDRTGS